MIITKYLNQTASWEVNKHTNTTRGDSTFAEPVTIRVRKQPIKAVVTQEHRGTQHYETVYYTEADVTTGDKLDGIVVKTVEEWVNYAGVVIGKAVFL